ncbi:DeoR/GlpR family DNA-binding transcription regulator [Ketogulonicigenium vulgare]|uniref:Glycerol-3-phosphate transcriptional regulator protein n=1 Tax=Ketogulonicigenium vulgare (strain WSH-001) TaxID=759362 RepID=F9Y6W4_KETVW|nr:DeoR/GlpR family DNA-binding transcription regulator [Ketogulonicigenium vulgare]ADO42795.1 glycerol-3-phosphate transcriptional regulator protein [Ketogulonicigenium vulgare Y25]AEM40981.1 Glycerol-3-phosphate transcriptional regulator protein [Ketogulonicigenium vulgare WSH-001]ALJ81132.1 DeoR family transcriptional regulator [Ketogulonicigenium vulgare]ANW33881.1 DeoR family transcriptional regulator [Ketogulonicigenium vulgare]AOZ54707.1 glycerol-3-phosphate transcriptional regulator pr
MMPDDWQANPQRQKLPGQARLAAILERLYAGGSVSVVDLAKEFNVSDMTVRRDLAELEADGYLERVHGGAVPSARAPSSLLDDIEPEYEARFARNRSAKELIAQEAARILTQYRTIALDVGTSVYLVAQMMDKSPRKRMFTNSLRVAQLLSQAQAEVYLPGGLVRNDEMSVTGPTAVAQFSQLFFDVAVLGISGVTTEGLFDYSIEDSELKRVYVTQSAVRIVLCDASKFQRMSLTRICDLSDITILITDAAPPADLAEALADAGVDVRIVGQAD